jgi:hypothetical protein
LGSTPERHLVVELTGQFPFLAEVGDCISPRKVGEAVHEGFAAGWRIS